MGGWGLRHYSEMRVARTCLCSLRSQRHATPACAAALVLLMLAGHACASEVVAGPMVGAVTDTSARVWFELNTAEDVTIHAVDVVTGKSTPQIETTVTGPSPFVCDTALPNLQPDRDYRVEVQFSGKAVTLPGPALRIHTMPTPGQAADFAVAFGSGADQDAKEMPIFRAIADEHPRAMVFLGDTGYLPESLEGWPQARRDAFRVICRMDRRLRAMPDLQPLLRTTACYATWDDRDFGTSNADRTFVFSPESRVAFQVFWPNPSYGTAAAPGIYTSFTVGDADFFLLDDRTYRDPDTAPDRKTMLGAGQVAWLEKQLAASRATFKIIMNGSQVLADDEAAKSWGHFEPERDDFIQWIFEHHVSGVMFASGDRHFGELTCRKTDAKDPASYSLYDLTSSPLADEIAGDEALREVNRQRVGALVPERNFGTFEFGGPAGHRHVTLRLLDEAGRVRLEHVVLAGELQSH